MEKKQFYEKPSLKVVVLKQTEFNSEFIKTKRQLL